MDSNVEQAALIIANNQARALGGVSERTGGDFEDENSFENDDQEDPGQNSYNN